MTRTILRRLVTAAGTLLVVTLVVFGLIHLAPGGPLEDEAADGVRQLDPRARAELERLYHLDQPLWRQYLLWLGDIARGDLGRSFHDRRPVVERIGERLGPSVLLNASALGLMIALAVPIGTLAAWRPGSRWDRFTGTGTYFLHSVPVFWGALLLQIVFAVRLGWLPLAGLRSEDVGSVGALGAVLDRARHLVLPVICLTYGGLAYLSRFVRATILDGLGPETARAARARGLSGLDVVIRHGFPLAAVPLLTLAGFVLPSLVGGSIVVETVFAVPGVGRLFVEAASQRDTPVLLGLTLVSGTATLAGVLAADLLYAVADPRVRRG